MKRIHLLVLMFFALGSAAFAADSKAYRALVEPGDVGGLTQPQIAALATNLGPTHTSYLVQSPVSCAPDAADPVWGPQEQMLGFSCRAPGRGTN
jgi:hypothetical protein